MSRARGRKQQEKEAFVQANPELQRNTTSLEVEKDSSDFYKLEATDENGNEVPIGLFDVFAVQDVATFVDIAFTPDAELYALPFPPWAGPILGGPVPAFVPFGSVLTLTEDGIGIAEGHGGPIGPPAPAVQVAPPPPVLIEGDDTISFGETILLDMATLPGPGPGIGRAELALEGPGFDYDAGGISLTVDYTVAGGSGDVIIGVLDIDGEDILFAEQSGGPAGSEGSLTFEIEEGSAFESAGISTTGSLEIVVTGIQYTTNFEGDMIPIMM